MSRKEQAFEAVKEFCSATEYMEHHSLPVIRFNVTIQDMEMGDIESLCQIWVRNRGVEISFIAEDYELNKIEDLLVFLNKMNDITEITFAIRFIDNCFTAKVNLDYEKRDITEEALDEEFHYVMQQFTHVFYFVEKISNDEITHEEAFNALTEL